jgi:hypothetical protein
MAESSPSRWEILARERNARVVLCNNVETFGMMDLARSIDRALRIMKNRLLISVRAEDVIPILEQLHEKVIELHEINTRLCAVLKIDCRIPRTIKQMMQLSDDKAESSAESEMPAEAEAKAGDPAESE